MRLLQPQKRRLMPAFAPHARFARWLGRSLSAGERRVIDVLEARGFHAFPSPRIILIDPPGFDSTPILALYLRYLSHRDGPEMSTCVIAPSRLRAERFADDTATRCVFGSPRSARSLRGATYQRLVILEAQSYGQYSPFYHICWPTQPWGQLYCQLVGPLMIHPSHLCIIHLRLPADEREASFMLHNLRHCFPEAFSASPALDAEISDFIDRIRSHNRGNLLPLLVECPLGTPPELHSPPDYPDPPPEQPLSQPSTAKDTFAAGCPAPSETVSTRAIASDRTVSPTAAGSPLTSFHKFSPAPGQHQPSSVERGIHSPTPIRRAVERVALAIVCLPGRLKPPPPCHQAKGTHEGADFS